MWSKSGPKTNLTFRKIPPQKIFVKSNFPLINHTVNWFHEIFLNESTFLYFTLTSLVRFTAIRAQFVIFGLNYFSGEIRFETWNKIWFFEQYWIVLNIGWILFYRTYVEWTWTYSSLGNQTRIPNFWLWTNKFTFFDNTSSVAIFFIAVQSVGAIPTRHTKCSENHIQN